MFDVLIVIVIVIVIEICVCVCVVEMYCVWLIVVVWCCLLCDDGVWSDDCVGIFWCGG